MMSLERQEREWLHRVWRAMMLSLSIDVCVALLAGESVPADLLDPEWSKRLGLRP